MQKRRQLEDCRLSKAFFTRRQPGRFNFEMPWRLRKQTPDAKP